jgi:acetylornithine deacetylase/succinyl-diaminopimelate desuccinylase-like protein
MSLQRAEKTYQTYILEVKDSGGHSSLPKKDNPIYRMAQGLMRLSALSFPVKLNDVTRGYFEKIVSTENGETAAAIKALLDGKTDDKTLSPLLSSLHYNAQIHTTCTATMLQAGQVENALAQSVKATVNCRVMPGDKMEDVRQTLINALGDEKITVTAAREPMVTGPSSIKPEVLATIERVTNDMWPGVPVIPIMSAGGTDSKPLRKAGIPSYGISGIFLGEDEGNMHGQNEHVGVKEVYEGKEFLYRLVKELAGSAEQGKS